MYVHTSGVLTNPPIPFSRCKHLVILRPVEILLHKRAHPSPPPLVTTLKKKFKKKYEVITSYFFKLFFYNTYVYIHVGVCMQKDRQVKIGKSVSIHKENMFSQKDSKYVCIHMFMYAYTCVCMHLYACM